LNALRRNDEALIMNEQILEIRVGRDGEEHPDSKSALLNVAKAQCNVGRVMDAHRNATKGLLLAKKVGDEVKAALFDIILSDLEYLKQVNDPSTSDERYRKEHLIIRGESS
jgi:hypothetical protein